MGSYNVSDMLHIYFLTYCVNFYRLPVGQTLTKLSLEKLAKNFHEILEPIFLFNKQRSSSQMQSPPKMSSSNQRFLGNDNRFL